MNERATETTHQPEPKPISPVVALTAVVRAIEQAIDKVKKLIIEEGQYFEGAGHS